MLNSLLDITRLESGAIEPHLSPMNLASIFADLQREFEPPALAKGLRLEFAQTSKVVTSDRILLNQLLQNIIGNAIKYTDTGVVKVSESLDSDGLLLSVQDTGRGIPDDKLERIFDEYYQVDQTGIQRSGVGLGLAIVREVSRILGYSVLSRRILAEARMFECVSHSSRSAPTRLHPSIPRDLCPLRTQRPPVASCCWRITTPSEQQRSYF